MFTKLPIISDLQCCQTAKILPIETFGWPLVVVRFKVVLIIGILLSGCGGFDVLLLENTLALPKQALEAQQVLVPITIIHSNLSSARLPCQHKFMTHELDHTTHVAGEVVRLYDSNGAGLGINDLDNDGDLDIVLANLDDFNTILWNEGTLSFRKEALDHGDSRAVIIVDVDGDGWLDIIFSRKQRTPPTLWYNNGIAPDSKQHQGFSRQDFFGLRHAYTQAWGDLDGDNDLDVVIADYDIALGVKEVPGNPYVGGGVIYYENRGEVFEPLPLAPISQALAVFLIDLNDDHRLDILVGNDFDMLDQTWLRQGEGWREVQLFETMTMNTMSFDAGDIDNDGDIELFATDMKPYADSPEIQAAWEPLMEFMHHPLPANDPQVMENVLQVRDETGQFYNQSLATGLDATGWSWSSKFGDLDNDGFLDVYVVNGMMAFDTFRHLPTHELVEENQVFQNDGQGQFVNMAVWGLNSTASGRSMSMADLDNDGDLDIVVNNLQSPSQLFENRLCRGSGLEIDLSWPQSKNTRAIGAQVTLYTSSGTYQREVRVSSGYLSGDPARIHFGVPEDSVLVGLEIRWPDGGISKVDTLRPQTLIAITRLGE